MSVTEIIAKAQTEPRYRVLGFGSSNTERFIEGMHWLDMLELAFHQNLAGKSLFLNAGIGGESTFDLLNRFDSEAADFHPDMTIITIGGNDSAPGREMSEETYRNNLETICKKLQDFGCTPVLQTYYLDNPEEMDPLHHQRFARFMEIICEVANNNGIMLVDHYSRWNRFYEKHPDIYKSLMRDAMHVNRTGNQIMGLYLVECFGLEARAEQPGYFEKALEIYELMKACNED